MSDGTKTLNERGHINGCPADNPLANPEGTHVDVYCDGCHDWFQEPTILANGTDVAWPAGWTRDQARRWRAEHGLSRPGMK